MVSVPAPGVPTIIIFDQLRVPHRMETPSNSLDLYVCMYVHDLGIDFVSFGFSLTNSFESPKIVFYNGRMDLKMITLMPTIYRYVKLKIDGEILSPKIKDSRPCPYFPPHCCRSLWKLLQFIECDDNIIIFCQLFLVMAVVDVVIILLFVIASSLLKPPTAHFVR